mgnify:CR=1 FL=1
MNQVIYQSVVYQEGKHFVAQCLNIDISSFGDTEQLALKNLQVALELYLEDSPTSSSTPQVQHPPVHSLYLQIAYVAIFHSNYKDTSYQWFYVCFTQW